MVASRGTVQQQIHKMNKNAAVHGQWMNVSCLEVKRNFFKCKWTILESRLKRDDMAAIRGREKERDKSISLLYILKMKVEGHEIRNNSRHCSNIYIYVYIYII